MQIERIYFLLDELEIAINEYDFEKSENILLKFDGEVKEIFEKKALITKEKYDSIQKALTKLNSIVVKTSENQEKTRNELGSMLNIKKKLQVYKDIK